MATFDSNQAFDDTMARAGLPPLLPTAEGGGGAMPIPPIGNAMAAPDLAPADTYRPAPADPFDASRGVRIPVGAGNYGAPDTDRSHAEGFDEVVHGYGAPPVAPPPTTHTAAATLPPVGSEGWVAAIRVMSITSPVQLQEYLTAHPDLFPQVAAAINPGQAAAPAPAPATFPASTVAPQHPTTTTQYPATPTFPVPQSPAGAEFATEVIPAQPEPAAKRAKVRATDLAFVAKTGWRGWLARTLNMQIAKGARELADDDMEMAAGVIRELLARDQALVIGVSSFKGGCGKTRIATMLGKVLAEILDAELSSTNYQWNGRQLDGAVCAIDTDWYGLLRACSQDETRLRYDEGANMTTLCSRAAMYGIEQVDDISHYIQRVEPGYCFIPGNRANEPTQLVPEGYLAVLDLLRSKFAVIIVDMAQVGNTDHYKAVLGSLDGLIMVTSPDLAEVGFLDNTRNTLSSRPPAGLDAEHLIKQRITVINNYFPESRSGDSHSDVAARLKLHEASGAESENPRGSDVAEVPFDKEINSQTLVSLDRLRPATRYGIQMAAGALLDATLNLSGRE